MSNIKIWAHRGASAYAPENTLAAFKKAMDMRADGVELDVQMTRDGEIVVTHDESIDRVSSRTGYVKDYTYDEIRKFNFNNHMKGYDFEQIPTLREVYELLKDSDMMINVELKTGIFFYDGIIEKVLKLTEDMGMEDRVIYSSFNHYTILKIKELNPKAKTGFLYADGPIDMPQYGEKYGVDALHPALYNLQYPGFIEECKKRNLEINVWTVNEDEHIRLAVQMGVNAIITNYPDKARKIIENLNWV